MFHNLIPNGCARRQTRRSASGPLPIPSAQTRGTLAPTKTWHATAPAAARPAPVALHLVPVATLQLYAALEALSISQFE